GLNININKYAFIIKEVKYLSYIIKAEVYIYFNFKKIYNFLSFINFYYKFILNFIIIVLLFIYLIKKNILFTKSKE
ncbi:hypothetical protein M440DRAFT_1345093, partial [Trichoderma longibrachiatum ATCC 18648]